MDEDRKLYREDVAAMLGIRVTSLARAGLPERDGTDHEKGHARPYWRESTVDAWLPSRPGKAWRKGQTGPAKRDSGHAA